MEQVNFSSLNQSHPTSYHNSIFQPITIYRAELNDTTLPGPRYMAFGPSVISVSINPLLLGILILIIALSGAVIYIIRRKKETEEKMLKDDEH